MKTLPILLSLFNSVLCLHCQPQGNDRAETIQKDNLDSNAILSEVKTDSLPECSNFDTTTIEGQVQQLWCRLRAESPWYSEDCDTLVDVNGDGWKDLVIPNFAPTAGSGPRSRVSVYLYHSAQKRFLHCEQLDHHQNPTFDLAAHTVFGWYAATPGGGYDCMLRWGKNKFTLDTLWYTEMRPSLTAPTFIFERIDYGTGKTKRWIQKSPFMEEYRYQSLVKGVNCE